MARVSYSPLIVDARGKVQDTVFSKWKGTNYIRSRVVPSNPKSVAQTAVRDSMARVVACYQTMEAVIKTAWNVYASPYGISGYNAMVKANRADEQATQLAKFTPVNTDITAIADLAAVAGAAGVIGLTWTDPGMGAGYHVYVATRLRGANAFVLFEKGVTLASVGALNVTGLVGGSTYDVFIAVMLTASDEYSASDTDDSAAGV